MKRPRLTLFGNIMVTTTGIQVKMKISYNALNIVFYYSFDKYTKYEIICIFWYNYLLNEGVISNLFTSS